jgi:hypothetical protein
MPNQKISELTTATNPSVSDVLPIVNGGSTKKITAASLLTNSLSATSMALSGVVVRKNIEIYNPELAAGASDNQRNFNNVFLHAANGQIAIGDCDTGKASRALGSGYRSVQNANIFIGGAAGKGVQRGTYGSTVPPFRNIAIGAKAGCLLGSDDDASCSGRSRYNKYNIIIGNYAGTYLCADTGYASQKNVIIGDRSFQVAAACATNSISIGYGTGRYVTKSRNNVFVGHGAVNDFSSGGTNYPRCNTVLGACAGCGLRCNSSGNVIIGYKATVNGFAGQRTVYGSVAIGNVAYAFRSGSIAMGSGAFAYQFGDIVIGSGSRSSNAADNTISIGRNNSFNSSISGSIVLGSCNTGINTSFVLGSPVFPLSARIDTSLTGQVSSLFVTINGVNRRIPILS